MLDLTAGERENVKSRLLRPLFPRMGNAMYGSEWERGWANDQKVCSSEYFKRYFTYGVPVGDVPDAQVKSFCDVAPTVSDAEKQALLEAFAARSALPRLISRLRQKEDSLSQAQAEALITAFTLSGDLLPKERGIMLADTRARAGMLVAGLLRQVPAGAQRQAAAERAIRVATPLGFAMECVRWIRHYEDRPEEQRVLADTGDASIATILVERIKESDAMSPVFESHPKDAPYLYRAWADETTVADVRQRLEGIFEAEPSRLDAYLNCYVGETWGVESGLPRAADLRRDQYDFITYQLPGDYIAVNLRLRYGSELDHPLDYPPGTMAQARRVAHQFTSLHNAVRHAKVDSENDSDEPPSPNEAD